jgi:hypothetical protein
MEHMGTDLQVTNFAVQGLFEKFIVTPPAKEFPAFTEPKGSLLSSQKPSS